MALATAPLTESILERLRLNMLEIPGIKTWYATSPSRPLPDSDLPGGFGVVGPGNSNPDNNAGMNTAERVFVLRLLVLSNTQGMDDMEWGAESARRALPFVDAVNDYFKTHPRLKTATLPDLAGVLGIVGRQDSGIIEMQVPGGAIVAGINFQLTIRTNYIAR